LWSGSDGVLWFYFNLDLLIWIWFYTTVVFAIVSSALSVDWWSLIASFPLHQFGSGGSVSVSIAWFGFG
jgi:hypothetical protein